MDKRVTTALAILAAERRNLRGKDTSRMRELCDFLVEAGHYPKESVRGVPAFDMMNNYGVCWNEYDEPHSCRHCGADLCDRVNGPPFKREIGMINRGEDGPHRYACPQCDGTV